MLSCPLNALKILGIPFQRPTVIPPIFALEGSSRVILSSHTFITRFLDGDALRPQLTYVPRFIPQLMVALATCYPVLDTR